MSYCKYALKWLRVKVICGKGCPILDKCPVLIMEDATEKGIEEAMEAMMEVLIEKSRSRMG